MLDVMHNLWIPYTIIIPVFLLLMRYIRVQLTMSLTEQRTHDVTGRAVVTGSEAKRN